MRQANIRDCAAITRYFAFLEEELAEVDHSLTEYSGARIVEAYRSSQGGALYLGPSFETISSIGANAAIIHYAAPKEGSAPLNSKEIYLLDSGGHYLDGTTDITRAVHFGSRECGPMEFQKEAYTRVLMGTLDLARAVWPKARGYTGKDLDILARRHLFGVGLDYKHGTGHGVGSLLCVHEGPVGISPRS